MRRPKISIALTSETLNKIDAIKVKYKIDTMSYQKAIEEICDMLLKKHESKQQELENLKVVINKIFYFLQEKVNEKDYLEEDFFIELIKMYVKIIEGLRE